MTSPELFERLDGLELSFDVANHLAVLDEDQIDELREKLNTTPAAAERVQSRVKSGLIRRRRKKSDGDDPAGPADTGVEAAPAAPAAVAAPEPVKAAPVAPSEPVDEPVKAPVRRRMATVVTRSDLDPVEPEVAAPVVEAPVVAETPKPEPEPEVVEAPPRRRPRMATVVTRDMSEMRQSASPVARDEVPEIPRPAKARFATVVTSNAAGRATTSAPSATELAAIGQGMVQRNAPTGGAKVVGTLNPDLLNTRLEADKKDFGPRKPGDDRKRADKKKGGKRVVQSRDLYDSGRRGRGRKQKSAAPQQTQITQAAEHKRVVRMEESILIGDLAHQMSVKAGEVAMKLMFDLGIKGANINTAIDYETAQLVVEMYEFKLEQVGFDLDKYLPKYEEDASLEVLRPPVVTVMGHVDHGKTSLLDAIRNSTVATGEAGGITQHIGAYQVSLEQGKVTFIDTPGHEAFSALRARGAKATDIAILVVAADDGVMPQTVEAIAHAKEAGVPIIVAVNKSDKPNANPERVRQAMTEYELIPEEWGGTTTFVDVSALTRDGIPQLLEMINITAELAEIKARVDVPASGVVIESKLDVGRGPVATMLVQSGTLKKGDIVVAGEHFGRVRTMNDDLGTLLDSAGPSLPVEVTGLSGVPGAGEQFHVVGDADNAKTIAEHIAKHNRQSELALSAAHSGGSETLGDFMKTSDIKAMKVIVKGDVQGSVEALVAALRKLSTEKVAVRIIHHAVGGITESDVNLAASSEEGVRAMIVGFNVRAQNRASQLAEQFGVTMTMSSIIYEIIDEVRAAMTGMLEPVFNEHITGQAEVRATFSVPKLGTIAGCMVTEGAMLRNGHVRVKRNGAVLIDSMVGSLRHFEKNVPEVKAGMECGLSVERFTDIEIGDILECYKLVATAAVL